jgi:hypothetical protein
VARHRRSHGLSGDGGPLSGWREPRRAAPPDDRVAAQPETGHYGRAADELGRAERVAEQDDPDGSADQRLQVQEGTGDGRRDSALREGEQRRRQHGAGQYEPRGGEHHRWGCDRDLRGSAGERRRQHGNGRRQELQRCHRDRIAAAQQPRLRHRETSRRELGGQHQAVAGEARTSAPASGDDGHADQRKAEPEPGDRPCHAVPENRGQHGHQYGGGPDQQRGVRHAGPLDAEVLQQHRSAVACRAGDEDRRAQRAAQPRPADDHEQGRSQGEPCERQPSGGQPRQRQLGQRHGGTPQHPSGYERREDETAAVCHAPSLADDLLLFWSSAFSPTII